MRRARSSVDSWRGSCERLLFVLVAALYRVCRLRRARRVPVIYQLDVVECGVACLAMLLAHCGHRSALSAARRVCDPGRDGLMLDEIVTGARALGLDVQIHSSRRFNQLNTVAL